VTVRETPPDAAAISPDSIAAAQCLRLDHATVEVVTAMRGAGVRPILLKGPAVVDLLFRSDPAARTYRDIDLLVGPAERSQAQRALHRLGFVRHRRAPSRPDAPWRDADADRLRHDLPHHADIWARETDGVVVDLHRAIHGAERIDPQCLWDAIAATAVPLDVLGVALEAPAVPVRLVHVVLHLRPGDGSASQAWRDLDRAIGHDHQDWEAAACFARSLGLDGQLGPLLRLMGPRGVRLADALGLPATWPRHLEVEFAASGGIARFLTRLGELPWHQRVLFVAEKLVPPPGYLRTRSPLASRGRLGLMLGYLSRLARAPKWLLDVVKFSVERRRRGC
jgi:hypothetical protein